MLHSAETQVDPLLNVRFGRGLQNAIIDGRVEEKQKSPNSRWRKVHRRWRAGRAFQSDPTSSPTGVRWAYNHPPAAAEEDTSPEEFYAHVSTRIQDARIPRRIPPLSPDSSARVGASTRAIVAPPGSPTIM
jgi:hypothetical protein